MPKHLMASPGWLKTKKDRGDSTKGMDRLKNAYRPRYIHEDGVPDPQSPQPGQNVLSCIKFCFKDKNGDIETVDVCLSSESESSSVPLEPHSSQMNKHRCIRNSLKKATNSQVAKQFSKPAAVQCSPDLHAKRSQEYLTNPANITEIKNLLLHQSGKHEMDLDYSPDEDDKDSITYGEPNLLDVQSEDEEPVPLKKVMGETIILDTTTEETSPPDKARNPPNSLNPNYICFPAKSPDTNSSKKLPTRRRMDFSNVLSPSNTSEQPMSGTRMPTRSQKITDTPTMQNFKKTEDYPSEVTSTAKPLSSELQSTNQLATMRRISSVSPNHLTSQSVEQQDVLDEFVIEEIDMSELNSWITIPKKANSKKSTTNEYCRKSGSLDEEHNPNLQKTPSKMQVTSQTKTSTPAKPDNQKSRNIPRKGATKSSPEKQPTTGDRIHSTKNANERIAEMEQNYHFQKTPSKRLIASPKKKHTPNQKQTQGTTKPNNQKCQKSPRKAANNTSPQTKATTLTEIRSAKKNVTPTSKIIQRKSKRDSLNYSPVIVLAKSSKITEDFERGEALEGENSADMEENELQEEMKESLTPEIVTKSKDQICKLDISAPQGQCSVLRKSTEFATVQSPIIGKADIKSPMSERHQKTTELVTVRGSKNKRKEKHLEKESQLTNRPIPSMFLQAATVGHGFSKVVPVPPASPPHHDKEGDTEFTIDEAELPIVSIPRRTVSVLQKIISEIPNDKEQPPKNGNAEENYSEEVHVDSLSGRDHVLSGDNSDRCEDEHPLPKKSSKKQVVSQTKKNSFQPKGKLGLRKSKVQMECVDASRVQNRLPQGKNVSNHNIVPEQSGENTDKCSTSKIENPLQTRSSRKQAAASAPKNNPKPKQKRGRKKKNADLECVDSPSITETNCKVQSDLNTNFLQTDEGHTTREEPKKSQSARNSVQPAQVKRQKKTAQKDLLELPCSQASNESIGNRDLLGKTRTFGTPNKVQDLGVTMSNDRTRNIIAEISTRKRKAQDVEKPTVPEKNCKASLLTQKQESKGPGLSVISEKESFSQNEGNRHLGKVSITPQKQSCYLSTLRDMYMQRSQEKLERNSGNWMQSPRTVLPGSHEEHEQPELGTQIQTSSTKDRGTCKKPFIQGYEIEEANAEESLSENSTSDILKDDESDDTSLTRSGIGPYLPREGRKDRAAGKPAANERYKSSSVGLRRSSRAKLQPLEYWRGERAVYRLSYSGGSVKEEVEYPAHLQQLKNAVAKNTGKRNREGGFVSEGVKRSANVRQSQKAVAKKPKKQRKSEGGSVNENIVQPKNVEHPGKAVAKRRHHNDKHGGDSVNETIVHPKNVEHQRKAVANRRHHNDENGELSGIARESLLFPVKDADTGEYVEMECVKATENCLYIEPDAPVSVCKLFFNPKFSTGKIRIKPHEEKGMGFVDNDTIVFYVLTGSVQFTIHMTSCTLNTGDFFFVPPKNLYNLQNTMDTDAVLIFTQIRGSPSAGKPQPPNKDNCC